MSRRALAFYGGIWLFCIASTFLLRPVVDRYSGAAVVANTIRLLTVLAALAFILLASRFASRKPSLRLSVSGALLIAGLGCVWLYVRGLSSRTATFENVPIATGVMKDTAESRFLADACCKIPAPVGASDCRSSEKLLWCASGDPSVFFTTETVGANFRYMAAVLIAGVGLIGGGLAFAVPGSSAAQPLQIFISYAHEDEPYKEELVKRLSILERAGLAALWDDRQIRPAKDWEPQLVRRLEEADLVVLLVSPDYLASHYCYQVECMQALQREASGSIRMAPVLVRECEWESAAFARLQVLPVGARPVESWPDREAAWSDVVLGLAGVIRDQHRG